jgi:hypothetical protein
MTFQVLTVVSMKMISLPGYRPEYLRSRQMFLRCIPPPSSGSFIDLMMEAVLTSEMSVYFIEATWHYI